MNFERLKKIHAQRQTNFINVKPGQFLEIHEKVGEGDNKRIWKFKGLVIKLKKSGSQTPTFTIRGKTSGITIEKVYPLSFLNFDKVLLMDEYKIRRAKLYYLRDKVGKGAKLLSIISAEDRGMNLVKPLEVIAPTADEVVENQEMAQEIVEETPEIIEEVTEVAAENIQEDQAETAESQEENK